MTHDEMTRASLATLSPASGGAAETEPLAAALNPASIAIIGASANPNKIGGRPVHYLARFGYKGRIYPINPHRADVQGIAAYPDVASLPEAPELAVIAVPGPHVFKAVDDCIMRGVRVVIIMTSGFGETSDPQAISAERDLVTRANAAGMRIVGPNSQGLANFGSGAIASFSTMFLEVEPADGPVGIISQSGMMSVVPYGLLRKRGIGVRHTHASGNDADVSLAELALAVVLDPAVHLLLLYIESIRDPEKLAMAAEAARDRDVPIVAVKTGRTARGQVAARSHTGALANEDRIVDAFFREHGIWRTRDVHEMVAAAELYLKGWRPNGRRLVVVSNSGASCVMAADAVHDVDLELATLADSTVAVLRTQLPSFATTTNPIDITGALLTNSELFGGILNVVAEDPGTDLMLIALPVAGTGYDVAGFAKAAADFMDRTHKPVVVAAPQDLVADHFRLAGIPTFENQTQAVSALAQLAHHAALMRKRHTPPPPVALVRVPPGKSRFLTEAQSLAFLRGHGLPIVEHRLCGSVAEAKVAFRELGGPVVLKASCGAIPHKSDHGLVLLDINSEREVSLAFCALQAKLHALGVRGEGIIVARMEKGRREFVLGGKVDPTFGPVLMVGDGGRYVEVLGDVIFLLPPVRAEDVREALSRLRIAPLMVGMRGEPPLDVDALSEAAVRLGHIISAGVGRIASIDLNPVIVGASGEGIVIVDALVERVTHDEQRGDS